MGKQRQPQVYVMCGFCLKEIEQIDKLVESEFAKSRADLVRKATWYYLYEHRENICDTVLVTNEDLSLSPTGEVSSAERKISRHAAKEKGKKKSKVSYTIEGLSDLTERVLNSNHPTTEPDPFNVKEAAKTTALAVSRQLAEWERTHSDKKQGGCKTWY